MPRLAFEEPKGGPAKKKPTQHRKSVQRDGVVVALKAATLVVILAIVGVVVFLANAGGEQEPGAKSPAVPEIETSHLPSSSAPTTPLAAIVAPEVGSGTAQLTVAPPPPSSPPVPPTEQRPAPGTRFAVVGQPCKTRGEYSFTASYEPVVCGGQRQDRPLVWRRVF
jgi:hypothetical protein